MQLWNKRVKSESKANILRRHYQLGKQVSNHLLCYAEAHIQIPHAYTTSHKMIPDLQVSYIPQLRQIRRYV